MVGRIFALATVASLLMGFAGASQVMACVNGRNSDNNLRWARYALEANIDMLVRDQHDYNGYRVRAIGEMQAARQQIVVALAYDRNHDDAMARAAAFRSAEGPDNRSDRNLVKVRRNVERIIDVLQRDNHDYGGHRVAAIGDLNQAIRDITLGLRFDSRH